ncbi:MAG: hypothetical protein ACYDGR_09380 [Candidatus Dormibacteria bacterium]
MLFLLVGGALLVTVGLLVFAGAGLYFVFRGGNTHASVSSKLPADLPADVALCDHFNVQRVITTSTNGSTRYTIQGECPINPLFLHDSYVALLEYKGWTVHDDNAGNLAAYNYTQHQVLSASLGDASNPNAAALFLEVVTGVKDPPSDFPSPLPSPSP